MSVIRTGRILASEPRAVMLREPESETFDHHSAVSGTINILTDTHTDAHKLLAAWSEIAEALRLKAEEILRRVDKPASGATDIEESG